MTAMTDEQLFVRFRSRERCRICGAYGRTLRGDVWKEKCRRGHKPCPDCGELVALRVNGEPRTHKSCTRSCTRGVRCASCGEGHPIQEMSGNACIFCWRDHGEDWLINRPTWLRSLSVREVRAATPRVFPRG